MSADRIQQIYIALFNRPADPVGLNFWLGQTNQGTDLAPMLDVLAPLPEYQDRFSDLSDAQKINSIYQALFGRDADVEGLTYFTGQLSAGALTLATLAVNVLDGAQGSDATIIANKVTASTSFTEALDTGAEVLAYDGAAAITAATAYLSGITSDAATIPDATATAAAVTAMVASYSGATGSTFTLTTAIENSVGSAMGDTFNGVVNATAATSTFQSGDKVDGGTGTDRLNVQVVDDALTGAPLAEVSNVEAIYVRQLDTTGAGFVYDAALTTGVTQLWNDRSLGTLGFDNVGTLVTIGLNDADGATDVQFTDSVVAGTSDSLTVAVADSGTSAADADLDVGNQTGLGNSVIEQVTFATSGAAKSYVNIAGLGNALTKVTVTGSQALDLAAANMTALKTIDASGMTAGGLTVDAAGGAQDVKFTGSGFDDSIDLGDHYTTADVLDGGVGTDNLTIDIDEADPAAAQANVTNFEKLTVTNATAGADEIDTAKFGVTTALELTEDSTHTTTITGLVSGATITLGAAVDDEALDVNLSDAAGAGDSITIVMNDTTGANAADIDLDLTGIETVTIDASKATATDGAAIDITSAQLTTLNLLAGADTLNLSGTDLGTVVTTVDASATTKAGGITVDLNTAAVQGATVTGTKNVDTINGSSQADNITGGNGADVIAGLGGIDTIDLTETTAASDTVSLNEIVASTNRDVIKGFTVGTTNGDEIEIGADETSAATLTTAAPVISDVSTKANTITLADADIVEFSFDAGASADLSAATDGTELLKAIATIGSATLNVDTDDDQLYLLAYDGGNAYLYHANETNDDGATLAAEDIQLVGVIEGVAVGSLVVGNFDLVA